MRILLVSDSHGNRDGIEKLIENEQFDYLFFLGDGLSDLGLYDNIENIIAVSGNCDFFSVVPNESIERNSGMDENDGDLVNPNEFFS